VLDQDVCFITAHELVELGAAPPAPRGTINAAPVERLFCPYAHAACRGEQSQVPLYCDYLQIWQCRLCVDAVPCLFWEPDHPDWDLIQRSVDASAELAEALAALQPSTARLSSPKPCQPETARQSSPKPWNPS